jgi:hypothetical protein
VWPLSVVRGLLSGAFPAIPSSCISRRTRLVLTACPSRWSCLVYPSIMHLSSFRGALQVFDRNPGQYRQHPPGAGQGCQSRRSRCPDRSPCRSRELTPTPLQTTAASWGMSRTVRPGATGSTTAKQSCEQPARRGPGPRLPLRRRLDDIARFTGCASEGPGFRPPARVP